VHESFAVNSSICRPSVQFKIVERIDLSTKELLDDPSGVI
jgi:hypothetical protein